MTHEHQVRVQSDGLPDTASVQTMDGRLIANVIGVDIHMTPRDIPTVELEIAVPVIDIHGEVSNIEFFCPVCDVELTHRCTGIPID